MKLGTASALDNGHFFTHMCAITNAPHRYSNGGERLISAALQAVHNLSSRKGPGVELTLTGVFFVAIPYRDNMPCCCGFGCPFPRPASANMENEMNTYTNHREHKHWDAEYPIRKVWFMDMDRRFCEVMLREHEAMALDAERLTGWCGEGDDKNAAWPGT